MKSPNPMRVLAVSLVVLLGSCGGDSNSLPALSFTATSPPAGTTGQVYAGYTFTASGGMAPLSWTSSGSLPPGLLLDSAGQLSGFPLTAGTYAFSVTVSDSSNPPMTASAPVSLKISDSAITVAPATPPAGTVSYPYPGFGFSAGGGSPPYTWTSAGGLPPGLVLGSDGTLSGTPTQAGTFTFSVTATDSAQPPSSGPPLKVPLTVGTPSTLALSAAPAPPAGVVGTAYGPFAFTTVGGYLPLHWSAAGALPPGVTLGNDGSLAGTPTTAGTFNFTITVTDSAPQPTSSSLPFVISVTLPPPPTINAAEAPTATVGSAYAPFQFTASAGVPPIAWSETPPLTIGLGLSASGVLSGTPTTAGQFPVTLNAEDALNRPASPLDTVIRVSLARPPAAFTATGSLNTARSGHAATLLLSGKVLVTGGAGGVADPTAELYDPATGAFTPTTGHMTEARSGHTATLLRLSSAALPNYGKVLIVGSLDTTAELYDPAAGTFAATGSLHHARTSPTATLLGTGKVLIAGGNTTAGDLTAELYDPTTATFSDTGTTTTARSGHTATLLPGGQVLIAGGSGSASAELYDPGHGTFVATTGSMTEARTGHTATLLGAADAPQNGYVLIIGTDGSADLYTPGTQTFARVGSLYGTFRPGTGHTASLRNDGTVLAAGGRTLRICRTGGGFFAPLSVSSANLFAPESDGFTPTGALNTPRDTHTATVLADGGVLVVGGTHHSASLFGSPFTGFRCVRSAVVLSSAELFR